MMIRHNVMALNAHRNYMFHHGMVQKSLLRLSTGQRINSAADDPAGLAISERMRGQIRGLKMSVRNSQNMISMLQTAEGGLNETHAILQRLRELATQAANGTYSDQDRELLNREYEELKKEIDRISESTHYNNINLLDGTAGAVRGEDAMKELGINSMTATGNFVGDVRLNMLYKEDGTGLVIATINGKEQKAEVLDTDTNVQLTLNSGSDLTLHFDAGGLKAGSLRDVQVGGNAVNDSRALGSGSATEIYAQVGANGGKDQRTGTHLDEASSATLGDRANKGSVGDSNILTQESAREAIDILDAAINQVSGQRAAIGASINRLEHTINSLEVSIENLTAAESRIRDADMAEEMMNFAKHNILMQAAQAMMAQASQMPYKILELLKTL